MKDKCTIKKPCLKQRKHYNATGTYLVDYENHCPYCDVDLSQLYDECIDEDDELPELN